MDREEIDGLKSWRQKLTDSASTENTSTFEDSLKGSLEVVNNREITLFLFTGSGKLGF